MSGKYGLELDGVRAGWVWAADGPAARPGEALLHCGAAMHREFWGWLASGLRQRARPRQVTLVDPGGGRRRFAGARLLGLGLPALDLTARTGRPTLSLAGDEVREGPAALARDGRERPAGGSSRVDGEGARPGGSSRVDGEDARPGDAARSPQVDGDGDGERPADAGPLQVAGFRLRIDGLEAALRVRGVAALAVPLAPAPDDTRELRRLGLCIDGDDFDAWDALAFAGPHGSLAYLAAEGRTVVTAAFRVVGVRCDRMETGSEGMRIEVSCADLQLALGPGVVR